MPIVVFTVVPVDLSRSREDSYRLSLAATLTDTGISPEDGLVEPGDGTEEGTCLLRVFEAFDREEVFQPLAWRSVISGRVRLLVARSHGSTLDPSNAG